MGRLKELRKYVDQELNKMEDVDKGNGAIVHLYGVSLAAAMIARKRGLDPSPPAWTPKTKGFYPILSFTRFF